MPCCAYELNRPRNRRTGRRCLFTAATTEKISAVPALQRQLLPQRKVRVTQRTLLLHVDPEHR